MCQVVVMSKTRVLAGLDPATSFEPTSSYVFSWRSLSRSISRRESCVLDRRCRPRCSMRGAHGRYKRREIRGVDVGHRKKGVVWTEFLASPTGPSFHGVHPAIFDAHKGFETISQVSKLRSPGQRFRFYFLRNALATPSPGGQRRIAPLIRTIFSQLRA